MTPNIMEKFLDLVRESVIVQGLITLSLVITVCYMWASGKTIPPDLLGLLTLVIGFYFGSKVQSVINKRKV